jgi:hypothetical protein
MLPVPPAQSSLCTVGLGACGYTVTLASCVTCAAVAVWALANEPNNIDPATTAMAIFRIKVLLRLRLECARRSAEIDSAVD